MHECQEIWSANIDQKNGHFLIYERDLIIGFKGNQTIDENKGKHVTTTCLFVIFSDRTEERFSIKKAFTEIAKLQN